MNDVLPLLESSQSSLTRELLRSALRDGPAPHSKLRVAAALGLTAGAVAVAAPVAASVPGAAAAAVSAAGATSKVSAASTLVLGKWLLSGLVGGALLSGTVAVVQRAEQRKEAAAPPATAPVARVRVPVVPPQAAEAARSGEPMPPADAPATVPVTTSPKSPPVGSSSADAATSRALGTEAARIDAARQALGRGDVQRALTELDWYERSKVVGVLDREAELLRIRALAQAGQAARAVELAERYLATRPRDAYAAQLEKLIASRGATFPSPGGSIERATDISGRTR